MASNTDKKLFFRSSDCPTTPLPFGVRSVGYYLLNRYSAERRRRKFFVQLFWMLRGKAEFATRDGRQVCGKGEIFFYFPGDVHDIRIVSDICAYRWLTLDGNLAAESVRAFGFGNRGMNAAGPCPEALFIEMQKDIQDISPFGQRKAMLLATEILMAACGQSGPDPDKTGIAGRTLRIIDEEYSDRDLDVNRIAERLGVHRTVLSKAFKKEMGISVIDYLVSYRVQKGLSLIRETDWPVARIAVETGYSGANYFAKSVRRAVGMSPTEFRHN